MDLSLSKVLERITREQSGLNTEISDLSNSMQLMTGDMEKIKKKLYGKFGKSIQLEKSF